MNTASPPSSVMETFHFSLLSHFFLTPADYFSIVPCSLEIKRAEEDVITLTLAPSGLDFLSFLLHSCCEGWCFASFWQSSKKMFPPLTPDFSTCSLETGTAILEKSSQGPSVPLLVPSEENKAVVITWVLHFNAKLLQSLVFTQLQHRLKSL